MVTEFVFLGKLFIKQDSIQSFFNREFNFIIFKIKMHLTETNDLIVLFWIGSSFSFYLHNELRWNQKCQVDSFVRTKALKLTANFNTVFTISESADRIIIFLIYLDMSDYRHEVSNREILTNL